MGRRSSGVCPTALPCGHSVLVPPLPIPNRSVKRDRADDSAATRAKVGHRKAPLRNTNAPPAPPAGRWRFYALTITATPFVLFHRPPIDSRQWSGAQRCDPQGDAVAADHCVHLSPEWTRWDAPEAVPPSDPDEGSSSRRFRCFRHGNRRFGQPTALVHAGPECATAARPGTHARQACERLTCDAVGAMKAALAAWTALGAPFLVELTWHTIHPSLGGDRYVDRTAGDVVPNGWLCGSARPVLGC